jgi:YafQ family addiction module toxin component
MAYALEIFEAADRKFGKMRKRERKTLEAIDKKIEEILQNPHRFKPLGGRMHGIRRVHIESSFVLTYDIDEGRKAVRILDFGHHDDVYV